MNTLASVLPPSRALRPGNRLTQRAAVLTLLNDAPRTQSDMVDDCGLSQPVLTRVVRSLREDGLIESHGKAESTGGRRATVLRLRADSRTAAGIRLRRNTIEVLIVNLSGEPVHRTSVRWSGKSLRPEAIVAAIDSAYRAVSDDAPLIGMRVAVPGVVDPSDATVSMAPDLGWRKPVALQPLLAQRFDLPVTIDNDVNVMCAGEYADGALVGSGTGAVVFVGHRGIGAAVMSGGRAQHGTRGASAEVGQVPIGPGGSAPSIEEAYCLPAIAHRLGISGRGVKNAAATMFRRAAEGDRHAATLAQEVLDGWSYAITVVALIADPDRIALAGALRDLPEESLATVQQQVARRVSGPLQLQRATLGEDGMLSGAAGAALRDGLWRGLAADAAAQAAAPENAAQDAAPENAAANKTTHE